MYPKRNPGSMYDLPELRCPIYLTAPCYGWAHSQLLCPILFHDFVICPIGTYTDELSSLQKSKLFPAYPNCCTHRGRKNTNFLCCALKLFEQELNFSQFEYILNLRSLYYCIHAWCAVGYICKATGFLPIPRFRGETKIMLNHICLLSIIP